MALNPLINLIPNGEFSLASPYPAQFDVDWGDFPGPDLATVWANLLPANGSGGPITFPTLDNPVTGSPPAYTPTPYTAPSTNAPAGNAAFIGWYPDPMGALTANLTLQQGYFYTFTYSYAGDVTRPNLNWYEAVTLVLADGTLGDSTATSGIFWNTFNPSGGWIQRSISFYADVAGTATLNIYGLGTDGTFANGHTRASGATVAAPVLLGGVSFTYQSAGVRAWPPAALPVGVSQGTQVAGNDSRLPTLDANGNRRPRMEAHTIVLEGTMAVGRSKGGGSVGGTTVNIANSQTLNGTVVTVTGSLDTLSTSSGDHCTFDVLVGGASLFPDPATLPKITSTTQVGPAILAPVRYGAFLGPAPVTVHVTSVQGTADDLTVTLWVDYD